jgi:hypothetical protein
MPLKPVTFFFGAIAIAHVCVFFFASVHGVIVLRKGPAGMAHLV